MATIFVHLIPDVRESFETYSNSNDSIFKKNQNEDNHRIPYVELAICGGFFLIFFIEEIMHSCLDRYYKRLNKDSSKRDAVTEILEKCSVRSHSSCNYNKSNSKNSLSIFVTHGSDLSTEPNLKASSDDDLFKISKMSKNRISNRPEKKINETTDKEPLIITFMNGLIIITAFSVHSIFDGLSIGLQKTVSEIWSMFFAITTHKLVIAFVLSMQLYDQSKRMAIVAFHMAFFSIMSPIGILIVIITEDSLLGTESETNPIVILLISLATGTLLYVVFFEILQKDKCNSISGLVQFFSIIVGFGVMLVINLLISE